MLKVVLKRLKPLVKEINTEEQAGFRAGKRTKEKIINLRILCEKYLQHQQNLKRQPYEPLCERLILMQTKFAPLSSSTTRLQEQFI